MRLGFRGLGFLDVGLGPLGFRGGLKAWLLRSLDVSGFGCMDFLFRV